MEFFTGMPTKFRRASDTFRHRDEYACLDFQSAQEARATLPALMHEVHTFSRLGVLPTNARTRWMFGFQRRLVLRCEWETLCPKLGLFPQISQFAATMTPSVNLRSRSRRIGLDMWV